MPIKLQLMKLEDFTGGMNLRADQFQLKKNESPDILNMDVDPRGGVRTRRGIVNLHNTALPAQPKGLMRLATVSGTEQVLCSAGGTMYYTTGSNWTSTGITVAGRPQGQSWMTKIYIQDGVNAVKTWTGTTAGTLGTAWSPDVGAPTGGNMPIGKSIAAHANHMFVANVKEGATSYPHRVRFSHIGRAEDWRDIDFFDVTPDDGDQITALMPFRDHLLIFKHRSIHALYGFAAEDFNLLSLTYDTGTPSPESVVNTPTRAYWWSAGQGLWNYDGSKITTKFNNLRPAYGTGIIPPSASATVCLGAHENKVYAGVMWGNSRSTLVFDPTLGDGAWTRFDIPSSDLMMWRRQDGTYMFVGFMEGKNYLYQLEKQGSTFDTYVPNTPVAINAHWYSPWLDAELAAAKKRWKRPRVVGTCTADTLVFADVYRNFDDATRMRHIELYIESHSVGMTWGEDAWAEYPWGVGGERHDFDRLTTLGTTQAVQIRLFSSGQLTQWGVDSITIPYQVKRLR